MTRSQSENLLPMRQWLFYRVQLGVTMVLAVSFLLFTVVLKARLEGAALQEQTRVLQQYEQVIRSDLSVGGVVALEQRLTALAKASSYNSLTLVLGDEIVAQSTGVHSGVIESAPVFHIQHVFSTNNRQYRLEAVTPLESVGRLLNIVTALVFLFGVLIVSCIAMVHHRVTKRGSSGIAAVAQHMREIAGRIREQMDSDADGSVHRVENTIHQAMQEIANLSLDTHESASVLQDYHQVLELLSFSWKKLSEMQRHEAIAHLAAQVAHDIRSPLTALQVIARNSPELDEKKRIMVRDAVQRIDDIANDLATNKCGQRPKHSKALSSELLSSLVEPLISEKRTQHRGCDNVQIEADIHASTYSVFAKVNVVEFKRVVSNLVNNAVEAMEGEGEVIVHLDRVGEFAIVRVADNGNGIPEDVLPKLAQRGVTVGKDGGSGLGLYHARKTIESWGGSFRIESTIGKGTTVTVRLPLTPAPQWFVEELVIRPGEEVVVLDDDASIHQVWKTRFADSDLAAHGVKVHHCSTCDDFRALARTHPNARFLCDYELLGQRCNGLDLIEELGIAARAVLVSSRYADPDVRARCAQLGVRIIPKGLAGIVPIDVAECATPIVQVARPVVTHAQTASVTSKPRILVIDDDESIRFSWSIEKFRLGVEDVQFFTSMEACEASSIDYEEITHAFLDKNIPGSDWDLKRTITHLKTRGIPNIIVASGEQREALLADPTCASADDVLSLKIPQNDDYFVNVDG